MAEVTSIRERLGLGAIYSPEGVKKDKKAKFLELQNSQAHFPSVNSETSSGAIGS
jgi:hypothetical protein